MEIKKIVSKLIEKHRTNNPFKLAKRLNIEIIYDDLGDIKGLFKKILRRKYIFINSTLSEFEKKIICAHELGHAYLHSSRELQFLIDKTTLIRSSKLEYEANLFAHYLIFENNNDEYFYGKLKMSQELFEYIKNLKE